jgi:soluble calcium-activated nucleotidase 1
MTNIYNWEWVGEKTELRGALNEKGRGMELSFLVQYEDSLYTCDYRSGIVYELIETGSKINVVARYILMDGDGGGTKGFKCEWGTVKDDVLYIGSFGKEWEENGKIKNGNPMWIKTVDSEGIVDHVDWAPVYQQVRAVAGAKWPGYLFHEAVMWNPNLHRWYFLPRRMSTELYDPKLDEHMGTNILVSLDEKFSDAQKMTIGTLDNPTRGFSCFKFIPGRRGEILAIKSEEVDDKINTYITAFNLEGEILLPEQLIETGLKYEGIEFTQA